MAVRELMSFPRRLPGYLVGKTKRELREILKSAFDDDEFRERLVEAIWGEEDRDRIRRIIEREIDRLVSGKEPLRAVEEPPKRRMVSFGLLRSDLEGK